jgi:gluconolactonase
MECLVEGLAFPEGLVVMADGSVIVVELMAGRVTRCWNGRSETICETGGGPNGAAIGPDGALWVCNNGGVMPGTEHGRGRIERIDLATGRCERVYEICEGIALRGPNDLVFDATGRLWFKDRGSDHDQHGMIGGLFTALPDGSQITAVNRRSISYTGSVSRRTRGMCTLPTRGTRAFTGTTIARTHRSRIISPPQWVPLGLIHSR